MSEIARFSVSLEGDLLAEFDRFCEQEHIATRSEAVRQLIRERLTSRAWESDAADAAGTLTIVYDHHRPQLRDRLTAVQHDHTDLVVATLHVHLSHELCLEVIVLRGPAGQLRDIAAKLRGMKGIFQGELVMASAEEKDASEHAH
jgi:CopG family nickel-responsive transcriptional regulator